MKDMVEFETITRDIRGIETVIKAVGDGPPVLFLHGAATIEGFGFARGLADRFRVLCPSHPGMGFSGPGPMAGLQDVLIHTLDVMDALGLDRPHVVGFSMGGWLASELAAVAREDLPGALAHDPQVALRYFPGGDLAPSPEDFGAARDKEMATLGGILGPFGMGHPNLARWLGRITNPTLIVWGAEDRLLPAGQAPEWQALLPDARVHLVPGAGHLVMQEKPAVMGRIGDFLAGED